MVASQASDLTYEQFKEEWLIDVLAGRPSTVEKGHRFAVKLITQWLDVTEDDQDLILCDGPGDGGIDVAYLQRADTQPKNSDDNTVDGDAWYLIQSKFGENFGGSRTILEEGRKVIATLAGEDRSRLADSARNLAGRIDEFRKRSSEHDRIILVFATENPLSKDERDALAEIRTLGSGRFPNLFDVRDIAIKTIYDLSQLGHEDQITVSLRAQLEGPDDDLKIGGVRLRALYNFLKEYEDATGNLDRLYDRNVRRYLGRGKINKGIHGTIENTPELFGLFNNGITLVVDNITSPEDEMWSLVNPYIVNGCQTTRTIWDVLKRKLDSGGTGSTIGDDWEQRLSRSIVVAKIVKSDSAGTRTNITKYTNTQNGVRQQDFVALDDDYQTWKQGFERDFSVFLEIQRGGWEAQKALQKRRPSQPQFQEYGNAFELIKIIGAGWYELPGTAFLTNDDFLPSARPPSAYTRITRVGEVDNDFGHRDLYAAFLLKKQADRLQFGRAAKMDQRRQTKFLFYMVTVSMLRSILQGDGRDVSPGTITDTIVQLGGAADGALRFLADEAARAVDEYLDPRAELNAYGEDAYKKRFSQDMNAFLKADDLGKEDSTPKLRALLRDYQRTSKRAPQGGVSLADTVLVALQPDQLASGNALQ